MLLVVVRAEHQRIDLRSRAAQSLSRSRRGHDPARGASSDQSIAVAGGEVDTLAVLQSLPGQPILAPRRQPLADGHDRALAAGLKHRDRAAGRFRSPGHVDLHAPLLQLCASRFTVRISTQGAEELHLRAELGQHDGGDPTAARRPAERARGGQQLPGLGKVGERNEIHPLDMTDHRDARHAGMMAAARASAP